MSNDESKKFKRDTSNKNSDTYIREKKMKKKRECKRRKSDVGVVTKIIINGVETGIVMYNRLSVNTFETGNVVLCYFKLFS